MREKVGEIALAFVIEILLRFRAFKTRKEICQINQSFELDASEGDSSRILRSSRRGQKVGHLAQIRITKLVVFQGLLAEKE